MTVDDHGVELDQPQGPLDQQLSQPGGEFGGRADVEWVAAAFAAEGSRATQRSDRVGDAVGVGGNGDHHRLAEMQADAEGTRYEPEDPAWAGVRAMGAASFADPDVFRARLDVVNLLASPTEVMARPGVAERVMTLSAGAPRYANPGPDRAELLALIGPH